ncbi:hypothetical protein [Methylorubrum populi]
MNQDDDEFLLRLVGYYSCFERGFAIPIFGSSFSANVLYSAECFPPGDHLGVISAFTEVVQEGVTPIVDDELPAAKIGSKWLDVFLWDGRAYFGTADEIWRHLSGRVVQYRSEAPLIIFDLASISLSLSVKSELHSAFKSLNADFGEEIAHQWVSTILRREVILGISRSLLRSGRQETIPLLEEGVEVHSAGKGVFEIIVREYLSEVPEIEYLYEITPLIEIFYEMFILRINVENKTGAFVGRYSLKFEDLDPLEYYKEYILQNGDLRQAHAMIVDSIMRRTKEVDLESRNEILLRDVASQTIFEEMRHKRKIGTMDRLVVVLLQRGFEIFIKKLDERNSREMEMRNQR